MVFDVEMNIAEALNSVENVFQQQHLTYVCPLPYRTNLTTALQAQGNV